MKIETIEIKAYDSTDVDVSWWTPDHYEDVYFPVELTIGAEGSEAGDLFRVLVATPEGLRKHGRGQVLAERATLILDDVSPKLLREALESIVRRCDTGSWTESVLRLQRYFSWEFERS